jgi:hypothetical protein
MSGTGATTDVHQNVDSARQEALATRAHGKDDPGCQRCGGPLRRRPARPRKFCSDTCRSAARHKAANRAVAAVRAGQLRLDLPLPSRFLDVPTKPRFAGPGYDEVQDQARLKRHCERVLAVLRSTPGRWWTYAELARAAGIPEGSCRTRVSNLRCMTPPWPIEDRTRPDRFKEVRLVEGVR